MKHAMKIIAHSIRMLLHAPATTLRVLAPALAIQALAIAALVMITFQSGHSVTSGGRIADGELASFIWSGVACSIVFSIGTGLMAILWHRHVLLNSDAKEAHDRLSLGTVVYYIWRVIVLVLLQMLILLPLAFLILRLFGGLFTMVDTVAYLITITTVVTALVTMFGIWLGLRLSLILPAAALNHPLRIGESWERTSSISGAIWGVALILSVAFVAIGLLLQLAVPQGTIASTVVELLLQPIYAIVSASILTTLYGNRVMEMPLEG